MSPITPERADKTAGKTITAHCFLDMVAPEAEVYARQHTQPMSDLLEEIERFTLTQTSYPSMLTGRVEGKFLQFIVQLASARNIIEIGTFTGYSALAMAEVLPPDGTLHTIDHNPDHARIAQAFFNRSEKGGHITLHLGEALDVLRQFPAGQTDLVFIDADKQGYCAYYREAMRLLRGGGLIIADNALWYGRVMAPTGPESQAMADFNELVRKDGEADKLFLTIRDGVYLIKKSGSGQR